ncbi:MAG: hypothetical protein LBD48_05885, partial [Treponema sp.]|nr:hypothetical protein [Treponema sp.]
MRKLIMAAGFWAVCAIGSPLFAQQISPEKSSEYFYENITLEKVYPSRLGYILQYRKGLNGIGRVYVPNEWFTAAASKAELITLPPGKNWPSMTVFYKEGEFSHLRLYVHRWKGHNTWGNVPLAAPIDQY